MINTPSAPQKLHPVNKVLILGCGDIGQRLAQQLNPDHYQITGIRRNCPPDTPKIRYLPCDLQDLQALETAIAGGFHIIVMTITPDERSDAGYEQAYVRSCRNLVNALVKLKQHPDLIIFASSTAVYAQDDGSWVDEESLTEPTGFAGRRLLEAEAIIHHSGFTNTLVRFSGIYGPGRNRLIEQVRQRNASASPHYTNRIHADDCAGFLAHLINHHQQTLAPVYIATDSAPTPMVEVVSWIAGRLGVTEFLSPAITNERNNRRLSNARMLASGYKLKYESYRHGYGELLESTWESGGNKKPGV